MIPTVTHLQFLVLGILLTGGELPGRVMRERLAEAGAVKSGPAFYQLMARLEDSGYVEGRYEYLEVDGQPIRERHYRVTDLGERVCHDTVSFYEAAKLGRILGVT